MNEEHFLLTLKIHLRDLSQELQDHYLSLYEEKFATAKEAGLREEEISQSLGDPEALAKSILADHGIYYQSHSSAYAQNGWQEFSNDDGYDPSDNDYAYPYEEDLDQGPTGRIKIGRLLLILAFNFIFVWLVFGFIMAVLGIGFAGVVMSLTFIAGIFSILFTPSILGLFGLFLCLFVTGIGLLICLLVLPILRGTFRFIRSYINSNVRFVRGGSR